ncbi:MAG: hypothetical protein E7575_01970 [Ruminococcaceae bacterium]|nr:hypothetical protein [Oscillospiraceae bacterium]
MKNNNGRVPVGNYILAAIEAFFGAMMLSYASDKENTISYVFDADTQNEVKLFYIFGWILLGLAVVSIVEAVMKTLQSPSTPNTKPKRCPVCGEWIMGHTGKCQSCANRYEAEKASKGLLENNEAKKEKAYLSEKRRKCLFCDMPIGDDADFCGHCGRRQD